MWRLIARSARYDVYCWSSAFRALYACVTSTLAAVLISALIFLGVFPAPLLLWFSLGIVCAAVCLRVTRPDHFLDASQASGSFALSLLTGAPRSETASLLLLPPSHSGLLHLAMLDRDWLSAGGNLLFGSPGKSNRLTDRDLSQLTTHVHDVDCKHGNLNNSTYSHSRPAALSVVLPATPCAASAAGTSCTVAAAAAAAAAVADRPAMQHIRVDGSSVGRQRPSWSYSNLQQGARGQHSSSSSGDNSRGGSALPPVLPAVPGWRVPAVLPPQGTTVGTAHVPQSSFDELDWFSTSHVPPSAAVSISTTASSRSTGAGASGSLYPVINSMSIADTTTSSGSRGGISSVSGVDGSQLPPLPAWSGQPGHLQPDIGIPLQPVGALGRSNGSSGSSSMLAASAGGIFGNGGAADSWPVSTAPAPAWPAPVDHVLPMAGAAAASRPASVPGSATAAAMDASGLRGAYAAAAGAATAGQAAAQWQTSGTSSAAFAALSAHQNALAQSVFHQSLLSAWGSYASSLDSLDDHHTTVCAICLGSYRPGVLVTGLPCGHMYHKDCVMEWLLQQGRKSTCPMCKADVFA